MSIFIKQVSVKNLGPIAEKTMDFNRFNLIYGRNETGKTFLTEFLLASLFKDSAKWRMRELAGQGQVLVSGLEVEDVSFSPTESRKLEDFWQQGSGLPVNFARLLVVRGGQSALTPDVTSGVDRGVLKQLVSHDLLLDQIAGKIPPTIQKAVVQGGEIQGDRRGPIKRRLEVREKRDKLGRLLERVHLEYAGGVVRCLENKEEILEMQLAQQEKGKCYQAYCVNQDLAELEIEREKISAVDIQSLREHIHREKDLKSEICQLEMEIEKYEQITLHLPWLEQAVSTWEKSSLDQAKEAGWVLPILGVMGMLVGFILAVFGSLTSMNQGHEASVTLSIGFGACFVLVSALLLGFWFWRLKRWATNISESHERIALQEAYKERFGKSLRGATDLRTHYERLKEHNVREKAGKDLKDEKVSRHRDCVNEIRGLFRILTSQSHSTSEKWEEELSKLEENLRELDQQIEDHNLTLARLNVAKKDCRPTESEVTYNPEIEAGLRDKLDEIVEELSETRNSLTGLYEAVRTETGDPPGTAWSSLVHNLQNEWEKAAEEYREETADILAGIGLLNVLEEIRQKEDEKIDRALRSTEVRKRLFQITGHYDGLSLQDDNMTVTSKYGSLLLEDISTGAKEQCQLALRMGLVERITGEDRLFLILDDAFQHSDWKRRESLFDVVMNLVELGWQIIYLTMDDHILKIASDRGQESLGNGFSLFELN